MVSSADAEVRIGQAGAPGSSGAMRFRVKGFRVLGLRVWGLGV